MQAKEATNFKDLRQETTIIYKGPFTKSNFNPDILPEEIASWYSQNSQQLQHVYLVKHQNKFGLLKIYPFDLRFSENESSRHSHVIRLAEAATNKFSAGNSIFCYETNVGAQNSIDRFVAFIPYGLPAKGILSKIDTLVVSMENDFALAKESANELSQAFRMANIR